MARSLTGWNMSPTINTNPAKKASNHIVVEHVIVSERNPVQERLRVKLHRKPGNTGIAV